MINPYMQRQVSEAKALIDRLAPGFSWIQNHVEEATRFARQIEAMAARFSSPFEKLVLHDRKALVCREGIYDEESQPKAR